MVNLFFSAYDSDDDLDPPRLDDPLGITILRDQILMWLNEHAQCRAVEAMYRRNLELLLVNVPAHNLSDWLDEVDRQRTTFIRAKENTIEMANEVAG